MLYIKKVKRNRQKFAKRGKIGFIVVLALVVFYTASVPSVQEFIKTTQAYISPETQKKAWFEAKFEVLSKEINRKQSELAEVKPKGLNSPADIVQASVRPALNIAVEAYLMSKKSPLAGVTDVLMAYPPATWKKIIALSAAESSFCRRYPVDTFNCWGVGGSNLWTMGPTLADGIGGMNDFLEQFPKKGKKYADMTFAEMNGLYNQPATNSWLINNLTVIAEIDAL